MKRSVDKEFLNWKHDPERKALLVRGARQVGKTYSIRKLDETFTCFSLNVTFPQAFVFQPKTTPFTITSKLSLSTLSPRSFHRIRK